jgi:heat-inducible transcriptional repressor
MQELTKRQKYLLRLIVKNFIETASPVGSDSLVQCTGVRCSPATVRNEMANLEELGFLKQPHISAGRIPTEEGYRFYVNSLMRREQVNPQEQDRIRCQMEEIKGDINLILEEASRVLSEISNQMGFALSPWMSHGIFDRLELIKLTEQKVLVVIHVRSRLVKTVILGIQSELKEKDLGKTASILNERLSGLELGEIKLTIGKRFKDMETSRGGLLHYVVESASVLFDFCQPIEIHTSGTRNILNQPEFLDTTLLKSMLTLIEDRKGFIQLFYPEEEKTEIMIGQKNKDERLQFLSIIKAPYKLGSDIGTIGVIGPTRMRYSKILPLVDHVANLMNQSLS